VTNRSTKGGLSKPGRKRKKGKKKRGSGPGCGQPQEDSGNGESVEGKAKGEKAKSKTRTKFAGEAVLNVRRRGIGGERKGGDDLGGGGGLKGFLQRGGWPHSKRKGKEKVGKKEIGGV